jgi:predicted  nucleic acid-binding Zn-ribbon protein
MTKDEKKICKLEKQLKKANNKIANLKSKISDLEAGMQSHFVLARKQCSSWEERVRSIQTHLSNAMNLSRDARDGMFADPTQKK